MSPSSCGPTSSNKGERSPKPRGNVVRLSCLALDQYLFDARGVTTRDGDARLGDSEMTGESQNHALISLTVDSFAAHKDREITFGAGFNQRPLAAAGLHPHNDAQIICH